MKLTLILLTLLMSSVATASLVETSRLVPPITADESHPETGHINKLNQVLYVFDIDKSTENSSACNNGCAEKWPPILLTDDEIEMISGSNELGTITRKSGLTQLTINNRPVYTFYKDKHVLEANGHGLGSVWHVSQPASLEEKASNGKTSL